MQPIIANKKCEKDVLNKKFMIKYKKKGQAMTMLTSINLLDFIAKNKEKHWNKLTKQSRVYNQAEEKMLLDSKKEDELDIGTILFLIYAFYYKDFKKELFKTTLQFYKADFSSIKIDNKDKENFLIKLNEKEIGWLNEFLDGLISRSSLQLKEFVASLSCYKNTNLGNKIEIALIKNDFENVVEENNSKKSH